jgi:gliding motility-associated-like protein
MKRVVLILVILLFVIASNATHIAGGELYYKYQGPGTAANTDRYLVTMRLFRLCGPPGPNFAGLNGENVTIGIYNNPSLTKLSEVTLVQQFTGNPPEIQNTNGANPCLVPFVDVCYQIGTYQASIELPKTANGYTLSWIRYTRTSLDNVSNSSAQMGATFTTRIPGTNQLPSGTNDCPTFAVRDTNTVCKNSNFILDFSAVDTDGDSLSYKFSPAYDGQDGPSPPTPPPPSVLQPISLNYFAPYSATNPFGTNATINANTGIISGMAPPNPGKYVVCVTVEEWRNGVLINEHRKDFILRVENCSTVQPYLGPDDRTCDGFNFGFINESPNPAIISYNWSFGDGNTYTLSTPSHTYADTGRFLVKLKVTATGGCQDSSSKFVYVFPGFTPAINVVGSCIQQPIQFFDATTTVYGVVNTWNWNFGDLTTIADTSRRKDSAWLFPSAGTYQATLISTNSKGCIDTAFKTLIVRDKPIINLPFKDTLICSIDTLPLIANTAGSIVWTPNYNIINANSANPLVYPTDTTTYVITVNDGGCVNKDSIKVNVLTFIRVDAGIDSAICKTDTFRLRPISDALSYIWTASTGVVVDDIKYPLVQPLVYTKYYVTANLGKCQDRDSVAINPVPYPQVSGVNVNPICFGGKVQLNANIVGSNFFWRPTNTLLNPTTLNPIAGPSKTTSYIITATDTVDCPKPVSDTIVVEVIPIVTVNAGRDTSIVRNQPLQLFATTNGVPVNTKYLWTPNIGLSSDTIFNPIAILNITADSIKYKVRVTRPEGCFGEDEIVVRIFRTEPDIFIPTAFTPNNDGKNDVLKPIAVGITQLNFFRIYNRWGQLIFETKELEKGWDGTINGVPQGSGTFVFVAQGVDYTGKVVFRKGTCVLIR